MLSDMLSFVPERGVSQRTGDCVAGGKSSGRLRRLAPATSLQLNGNFRTMATRGIDVCQLQVFSRLTLCRRDSGLADKTAPHERPVQPSSTQLPGASTSESRPRLAVGDDAHRYAFASGLVDGDYIADMTMPHQRGSIDDGSVA
jgi:hypothetical protein